MIKLFIAGYPPDVQDEELIEMFSFYGMMHSINLIVDKVSLKHKGFGFIEMLDQTGADRAIAGLHGTVFKGRKITVKIADEDREKKPRVFRPGRFDNQARVNDRDHEVVTNTKRPRKLISR
ncbi:RNA recognition motif domain-containing protein [Pedobacter sp. PWIIR3]